MEREQCVPLVNEAVQKFFSLVAEQGAQTLFLTVCVAQNVFVLRFSHEEGPDQPILSVR